MLNREPTLILYSLLTGITAVQWGAVSMPTYAHIAVTVVVATLTALLNRQQVTPTVTQVEPTP